MWLLSAATAMELAACRNALGRDLPVAELITGVGPLECAVRLASWLHRHGRVAGVVNVGVAGGYQGEGGTRPALLDLCLARREVLGDLGACAGEIIEPFDPAMMGGEKLLLLDRDLCDRAEAWLVAGGYPVRCGTFVTVNCASASLERAARLARAHEAICENMEGAAVARVCAEWELPCLELRSLSNIAGERDKRNWRLAGAADRAGAAMALLLEHLVRETRWECLP